MERRNFFRSVFYSIISGIAALFSLGAQKGGAAEPIEKLDLDGSVPNIELRQKKCQTASPKTVCKKDDTGVCKWHVCPDFAGACDTYVHCGDSHTPCGLRHNANQ